MAEERSFKDDASKKLIKGAKEVHPAYNFTEIYAGKLCIFYSQLMSVGASRPRQLNCLTNRCGIWVSYGLDKSIGRCGLIQR